MRHRIGLASSIPPLQVVTPSHRTDGRERGGEAEPSTLDTSMIRDPVLRAAVEAAYEGWARKYPQLAEDQPA